MAESLPDILQQCLTQFGTLLVDQQAARVLVHPMQDAPGHWFGGGNTVRHPRTGEFLLAGRVRDTGDSRSGLAQGPRGCELVLLRSTDDGRTFTPFRAWNKADLSGSAAVLSIEGSALHVDGSGVRLLGSSE